MNAVEKKVKYKRKKNKNGLHYFHKLFSQMSEYILQKYTYMYEEDIPWRKEKKGKERKRKEKKGGEEKKINKQQQNNNVHSPAEVP